MSDLVSLCVLRVEINGDETASENQSEGAMASAEPDVMRNQRARRDITVETFPSRLETPRDDWGLLPPHSRELCQPINDNNVVPSSPDANSSEIGFFSGNPFVELTKGILHLYKEDVLSSGSDAVSLCLIGVPASMTCNDLLTFIAPCHAEISHVRIVRDSTPNQYMALLTFRDHISAKEFYLTYNGAPFNSLEPDFICRAVWVSRVEWATDGDPPPGHTELPTCPVCLERMDESVDGVLTILCNHAFHASCLLKWGDATCPVCRCVQSPELAETSECMQCGRRGTGGGGGGNTLQQTTDSLWICLVCGHVGCGRYQGGHAASHYRASGHCYALQLGSNRVWDYNGDNFVHRLLQNKGDGKLVATGGPGEGQQGAEEKVDAVQLEFTYLLTSQLDTQRQYFEEKLVRLESQTIAETEVLRQKLSQSNQLNYELENKVVALTKEKSGLEKKVNQLTQRLNTTQAELNEERQLGKALRNNQAQWQARLQATEEKLKQLKLLKQNEIAELKDQLRDVMFYINAQQAIDKSADKDEILEGTVTVGDAPSAPSTPTTTQAIASDGNGNNNGMINKQKSSKNRRKR